MAACLVAVGRGYPASDKQAEFDTKLVVGVEGKTWAFGNNWWAGRKAADREDLMTFEGRTAAGRTWYSESRYLLCLGTCLSALACTAGGGSVCTHWGCSSEIHVG